MGDQRFPDGFLWGVATSAQQIEGACCEGGRGPSVWDHLAGRPGAIADGADPSVACDHFHRWRDDLKLMHDLGVTSYRFSTGWSRVMPDGRQTNPDGLDFYDTLVDALLAAGIKPCLTLNHWDMPQALLDDHQGWAGRDAAGRFVDYTEAVARRLGDRVSFWSTHNEPWCMAHLGYEQGSHAPGWTDPAAALRASHHLLLSHGWAMEVLRSLVRDPDLGIVLNLTPAHPASSDPADVDAARQYDGFFNRWYLEPLFNGQYPADAIADRVRWGHLPAEILPYVQPGDLAVIQAPLDWLGVNFYSRTVLGADARGRPQGRHVVPADQLTEMGWEVYPDGLVEILERVHREYGPLPLYVTENGAAFVDPEPVGGVVNDPRRVAYLRDHVDAMGRALEAGVDLRGYFAWSLMDNFEWAYGYTRRFGLYGVDFETGERTVKDSALWYRDAIAAGGLPAR